MNETAELDTDTDTTDDVYLKPEPTRKTMHLPAATHAMLVKLQNILPRKADEEPIELTKLIARLAEHEMDRLAMDKQPAQQENQR
jgi:hypothetical protein